MNRILLVAGAAAWGAAVFVVVFLLTFPSDAVVKRIAWEVASQSEGAYAVEMASVSPWWVGLSADRFLALSADPADPTAPLAPFFAADNLAARVGLFSILRRAPAVTTRVAMGDATLEVDATLGIEEGRFKMRKLLGQLDAMPLEDLVGLLGGGSSLEFTSTGTLDADIDFDMSEGREKARGEITLRGEGIRIETVAVPAYGLAEMELGTPVDEIDLRLKGEDGLFEVSRGVLRTRLVEVEIEGEVRFADRWDRSRVELKLEVDLPSWEGTPLEAFRGMLEAGMARAKWSDDKYHYTINTTLGRIDAGAFREEREPSSARRTTPTTSSLPARPTVTPPPSVPAAPTDAANVAPPQPAAPPEPGGWDDLQPVDDEEEELILGDELDDEDKGDDEEVLDLEGAIDEGY